MKTYFVYSTTSGEEESKAIGEEVVRLKLAACANVFPEVTSFFQWEGTLNQEKESVLVMKTGASKLDELKAKVLELHSYDCPCIVAWPVEQGHQPFLDWVVAETRF